MKPVQIASDYLNETKYRSSGEFTLFGPSPWERPLDTRPRIRLARGTCGRSWPDSSFLFYVRHFGRLKKALTQTVVKTALGKLGLHTVENLRGSDQRTK